jgi:predicted CoA-binding protein
MEGSMTGKAAVEEFLSHRTLAIIGVSRSGKKFGNAVHKELKNKGYRLYPIHPEVSEIEGDRCWPSIAALPEPVDGIILVVHPEQTEKLVQEAAKHGIRRIWMQQGASSETALAWCRDNGIAPIHGECILMFAEPLGWFHRVHRWIWRVLGKLPR